MSRFFPLVARHPSPDLPPTISRHRIRCGGHADTWKAPPGRSAVRPEKSTTSYASWADDTQNFGTSCSPPRKIGAAGGVSCTMRLFARIALIVAAVLWLTGG